MVLQRYVLKEHVVPFLFSLTTIMFLLVIDLVLQMVDLILGKGVETLVVLELFFLNTAWMVALAVPMSVLVCTLMAFGRLSGDQEITAMRALGIGTHQVVIPVVFAGALLGAGLIWFNDCVLPEFNHRARMLASDIRRKRPAVGVAHRAGTFMEDFDGFRILFDRVDPETSLLRDVLIYKYAPDAYPVTIAADTGELRFHRTRDEAMLLLGRGEIHRIDESDPGIYVRAAFGKKLIRLGEAGRRLSRSASHHRGDREMSVGMMLGRIGEYSREIAELERETLTRAGEFSRQALLGVGGRPEADGQVRLETLLARFRADRSLVAHKQRQIDRLCVEVHKKFSIPAACVVFVLIGAPLGLRVRRSNPAVGAGISVGFFLVYWLCLIGGEKLADRGIVAPWAAMWSPNILVGLAGAVLSAGAVLDRRIGFARRRPCGS